MKIPGLSIRAFGFRDASRRRVTSRRRGSSPSARARGAIDRLREPAARDESARGRRRRSRRRYAGEAGRKRFLRAVAWTVLAAGLGAGHVWIQLQSRQVGYELAAARRLHQRLNQEKHRLEVELATLRSPPFIASAARSRLGLRSPVEGQVVGVR